MALVWKFLAKGCGRKELLEVHHDVVVIHKIFKDQALDLSSMAFSISCCNLVTDNSILDMARHNHYGHNPESNELCPIVESDKPLKGIKAGGKNSRRRTESKIASQIFDVEPSDR